MKQRFFTLLLLLAFLLPTSAVVAQEESEPPDDFDLENPMDQANQVAAGMGLTRIGGQSYFGFRIQPELALGKLGVGLDVPLLFSVEDGSFRLDEYTGGVGALRLIRHVRWGVKKRDPFYIRVGDMSGAFLGHGMLMNYYTNAASFEKRKVGAEMDILIRKTFGLEVIYTDFNPESFNLLGVRPYVRPFGQSGIPIVETFDIGVSYVTDHDNTTMKINDSTEVQPQYIEDGMNAFGADMGLIFINNRFLRLAGFAQYGYLMKNESDLLAQDMGLMARSPETSVEDSLLLMGYDDGSGFSVGLDFKFRFIANLFRVDARLERLWYNDYFVPQFYDAVYEMNKDAKVLSLGTAREKRGVYGTLTATVLNKFRIGGGLMLPDNPTDETPAMLQLMTDASDVIPRVVLRASYIKGNISTLKEAFTVDQRSLVSALVAYKVVEKPFVDLVAGVDYRWTYAQTNDGLFEATNHAMPYFGLVWKLPFGNNSEEGIREEE